MSAEEFIDAIKLVLLKGTIRDVVKTMTKPPGRNPNQKIVELSNWYNNLPQADQDYAKQMIEDSIDQSIFGFLCILDGVRAVDDSFEKGTFELYYVKENEKTLLNDPNKEFLHDLYN
jgi:hypothetical protein